MSKTGRNEPCPCGSGEKYKKCCLEADLNAAASENPATLVNQALSKAFAGQQFESVDDVQVFAEHKIQEMNTAPREELGGFSPEQLHTLLHYPLEKQQLIRWRDTIPSDALGKAPIGVIFAAIRAYLSDHTAKATVRGNLPRGLVKFVQARYLERFSTHPSLERVNKEEDFRELHIAHIVIEAAGLIGVHKGVFTLTKKAMQLSDADLFKRLFHAHIEKYNWAYDDNYPELDFIQHSICYSLVMLNRQGEKPADKIEFAEEFIRVFPMLLHDIGNLPGTSALKAACHCYSVRTIDRCWQLFGFVTLEGERYTRDYERTIVPTGLLQQVFQFPGE